jgi:hypothetical protein
MNIFKIGSSLNGIKNFVNFFHIAIIASFLLTVSFSGCGYKTPPVWVEKSAKAK